MNRIEEGGFLIFQFQRLPDGGTARKVQGAERIGFGQAADSMRGEGGGAVELCDGGEWAAALAGFDQALAVGLAQALDHAETPTKSRGRVSPIRHVLRLG